ncbi:MAG: phage major capsid protein, partial [Pseudomonadota bacterium]
MKTAKLAALMAAHMAAFFSNTAGAAYEKRDDATIQQVAEGVEKIGTTFEEYRKVNDARLKAVEQGKSTAEFEAKLAKMDEQFDAVTGKIDELRKNNEKLETRIARPGAGSDGKQEIREAVEYRDAWFAYLRDPKDQSKEQRMRAAGAKLEERDRADGREVRATFVTTGTNTAGGYALPREVEQTIMRLGTEVTPMRQIATVRQVGTPDYHELVDIGGAGFEWVGEGDTRNETDSPNMAEIKPTFGMLSARPKATEESIEDTLRDAINYPAI